MTGPAAEPGVTAARELAGAFTVTARLLDGTAEWADDQLAAGAPPKWVARRLISASRLIASAARGEPAPSVTFGAEHDLTPAVRDTASRGRHEGGAR